MKPIFRIIPLIYFIGLSLFWVAENYMSTGTINYIAITVGIVLVAQLFIKNKIAGLVTGVILALFSVYMLFAVVVATLGDRATTSEITAGTYKFMAFGGGLFGTGLIMAVLSVVYHAKMGADNPSSASAN